MKSWSHSGFNVHVGEEISPDDSNARLFLARYLKKAPLSEARLFIEESQHDPSVVYRKITGDGELDRSLRRHRLVIELLKLDSEVLNELGKHGLKDRGGRHIERLGREWGTDRIYPVFIHFCPCRSNAPW